LCGPEDITTPSTEIGEARRPGGRGAHNWKLHGWWRSRLMHKRHWFKFTAADYGFYNHMPAAEYDDDTRASVVRWYVRDSDRF
jgi:hypothetical protein